MVEIVVPFVFVAFQINYRHYTIAFRHSDHLTDGGTNITEMMRCQSRRCNIKLLVGKWEVLRRGTVDLKRNTFLLSE